MLPESGRVYHPAPEKYGGVGLVKSKIAIEFSKYFIFGDGGEMEPPIHFTWKGKRYDLGNGIIDSIHREEERRSSLKQRDGT